MKDFPKIEIPPATIESESPTPVQFLPSAMLSWRAPIMARRKPVDLLPATSRSTCDTSI